MTAADITSVTGWDQARPDRSGGTVSVSAAAQSTECMARYRENCSWHTVPQANVAALLARLSFTATQPDSLRGSAAGGEFVRGGFGLLVGRERRVFFSVS